MTTTTTKLRGPNDPMGLATNVHGLLAKLVDSSTH